MRLVLFGAPCIERGSTEVALPFERRSQLVAFLALKRAWVNRAELASLLWPDQEQKLAFSNLRKTLFRLASAAWAPPLESEGGSLRLAMDSDVTAFEAAVRGDRIADALALRRGELLHGFDDDANEAWTAWLAFERDRLRSAWREAALARLAHAIDAAEGIALSAKLLEADPLDEAALRAHVEWLTRNGQAARARQLHREFGARMARELGIGPSLPEAAVDAARAPRVAADGFVGRAVELRRIATLMSEGECRLLTLLGPGGAGKTRLARRAADELASAFTDGAAFVALEDVTAAQELAARIARELCVPLGGGKEPLAQVIDALAARDMLVVLDNFEQLAHDAAALSRILEACPRLRIMVTSRVRLALAMEWLLPVDGLPCPEQEDRDRVEAFDAARLFVQAAQRFEPALVPALEAASIVEICRAVDGLPLALELAAAWTRVLSCEAIAAELKTGTALLHAADAAHAPRHASFAVVFDHSWQLLSERERDALARLSVFRGGFSPESARAVTRAALPVLGALTDKSLLRKDGARLSMHPLVAHAAAQKLADGALRSEAEQAHAAHFDTLLAQIRRNVEDGDRDALARVEAELDNCLAALRWAMARDAAMLERVARVLLYFWDHRGRLEEGLALLREAESSPVAQADVRVAAHLAASAAHLEYRLDRYDDAVATAQDAMTRAPRDKATRLQALNVLGACSLRLGRHDDARRFYHDALRLAPEASDLHTAAGLLDNLALVEKRLANYDEALRLSLRSLNAHRRLRDVAGEALGLVNLGALYFDRGEHQTATTHVREGLALSERHGLVTTRGLALANLTQHALRAGDVAAAQDYASRALDVARSAGNRSIEAWLLLQLVRLALTAGRPDEARAHLAQSLAIAVALNSRALQIAGVVSFAEILDQQAGVEYGRRVLEFARDHPDASAAQAAEIRAQLTALPPATRAAEWPGIGLDELVQRIQSEAALAYAPLLAALA